MNRTNTRSYDLFKTIVAVILVLILLLMLLRGCSTNAAAPVPTQVVPVQSSTELLPTSPAVTEQATEVVLPQAPTSSPAPTATEPPTATTEAATVATETPTPAASTETGTATPEQASTPQAQNSTCNTSAPSRLGTGETARVLQRLNVRSEPSIRAAIIKVNRTNTQVKITGGPVCELVGTGAYLWWQIQLPDGTQGWSAETPLNHTNYFLEPIQ